MGGRLGYLMSPGTSCDPLGRISLQVCRFGSYYFYARQVMKIKTPSPNAYKAVRKMVGV